MTEPSQEPAWVWLARVPFTETAGLQERLRSEVIAGTRPDTLLLCEHPPVFTLGRGARREHLLASPGELRQHGIAIHEASRGGAVTYHGPGQLIGYPIVRLRQGVLDHVQRMAAAILDVLTSLGIAARFRRDCPGIWVGAAKICAFGIHVHRRVAIHGFALNLAPNLHHYRFIVPCGLPDAPVTSVAALTGQAPTPGDLAPTLAAALADRFGTAFAARDPSWLKSESVAPVSPHNPDPTHRTQGPDHRSGGLGPVGGV